MNHFASKRFIALLIAVALFTVMVYTTKYSPIEISGAISVIFGIYTALQTYRGSTDSTKG